MLFNGIKSISIDSLGLSQIYISQEKYASVSEWLYRKKNTNRDLRR